MPACSRLLDSPEFRRSAGGIEFLRAFPAVIVVDLTPEVDDCYSLGPYTLFQGNVPHRTEWGDLLNRAKYQNDRDAAAQLGSQLERCIVALPLPTLSAANAIVAAPKGDASTPNLVGEWADAIAGNWGLRRLDSYKTRATDPQKNLSAGESETDLTRRIANSVGVSEVTERDKVLILDDTIRSGGTLREIGRALRAAGAAAVCGLTVAKDARFTQGGIGFLDREGWQ